MTEIVADVFRRWGHTLQGRVFNRPKLLAWFARRAQKAGMPIACSYEELRDVCLRTGDFSNVAHAEKLVAGEFVIGMDSGPAHAEERATVAFPLFLADFGELAAAEAQRRVALLKPRLDGSIDLVNDYLVFVAWAGLRGIFDDASLAHIEGHQPGVDADVALHGLFHELRHVGGHLVVGGATAPRAVQVRAGACAAALNERVRRALGSIQAHWGPHCPRAAATAARQATGLMWVGHPAMVQAGVFVFQELRARREVYAGLRAQVRRLGAAAYADAPLRHLLRGHVLECLRHRPPFPLLPRLAPEDAVLAVGKAAKPRRVAAGKSVFLAVGAALAGLGARWPGEYCPDKALELWKQGGNALPIFGLGPRQCVARDHVLEILVSALTGLLQLPELEYADGWWRRIHYDGPIITCMRLKMKATRAACSGMQEGSA